MRKLPPPRHAPPLHVPRRWVPAPEVAAEIEPRATREWIFVHRLEVVDEAGNDVTVWASDRAMVTGVNDDPPQQTFRELITEPGDYQMRVFAGGSRVSGFVATTRGGVAYSNTDGAWDAWADYATDGGRVTCWFGPHGGAFPAEFRKVFVAYVDGYPELTDKVMRLSLRGREKLLDRKLVTAGFADALGSENGVDLERTGIPGARLQQIVMGTPPPIAPILTNDVENVWLLQANPYDPDVGLPRLFDGGVELTYAGGIGTGQGGGTFRMLARENGAVLVQPVTQIRVELRAITSGLYATPEVSPREWTIADVVAAAGIAVDFNNDTQVAPGSTNFGCGSRVVEAQTIREILDDVATFQVASIGFDRLDRFYAKPILPSFSGASVFTFRDAGTYGDGNAENLSFVRVAGVERRVWQLKVRGGATRRSAMAAIVDDEIRDQMSRDPWMTSFVADITYNSGPPYYQASTVLDTDPTAEVAEVEIDSHEFATGTAQDEFALRFLRVHGAKTTGCTLEAPFNLDTMALGLLDKGTLQTERFGGAREARIVALHAQLGRRKIRFELMSQRAADAPGASEISVSQADTAVGSGGGGAGSGATGQGDAAPQLEAFYVPCSDKTSTISVGESTQDLIVPYPVTLASVYGALSTVQASGATFTVDVKVNGVSLLSTLITIDNGERSSFTAATPPVISAPSLAKGDRLTFHVTAAGTGGKGWGVGLVWYQTGG